jgi:hypothetical protein
MRELPQRHHAQHDDAQERHRHDGEKRDQRGFRRQRRAEAQEH